jgi:glucose 1-dehydrogenase
MASGKWVSYLRVSANKQGASGLGNQIEALGGKAITIKADVSNEEDVRAMFAKSIDRFGTLHIAVNNAGLMRRSKT